MLDLVASVLAQNGGGRGANPAGSLLLFVPLILLFYFVLIRPQRRRMQQHAQLIRTVGLGDEVETIGGMFGIIRRLDDEHVWLEVTPGTTIRFTRGAIRRKVVEIEEDEDSESSSE